MTINLKSASAALLAAGLAAGAARADFIAYDNAAGVTGLQQYGGSLGLDFDVNTPITVTQLGAFDNGDPNLLNFQNQSGVTVAVYDRDTTTQVGSSLTFSTADPGTPVNGNVFKALGTPINLPAGFHGSIVAFNDPNYNSNGSVNSSSTTNDGGGAITFVGVGRFGAAGSYPGNTDGGPVNRYDAGTFQFVATGVPEPASLGLLGLGAVVLFARRRRTE